jgi:Flp pilus assembly protein TadD
MGFAYSRIMHRAMSDDTPERAQVLARSGDRSGAARMLARYLDGSPGDTQAHFQLAHLWLELGDAERALQSFQSALTLEPDNAVIHSDVGIALEALGREVQAADAYRRAADATPPFPPACYNLALIHCRRRQWQEAAGYLRRALEQAPDFQPARHQLGLALDALGDEDAARACFDALLAADPQNLEARRAIADMHVARCRYDAAARLFEQCLELNPEDTRATLALGACLQELGRVDDALVHYRRLLKRDRSHYYDVVKKLTSASTGRFRVKSEELRRLLLG